MKLQTLQDAFAHKVGIIYSSETQIADKGLPTMIDAAADVKLVAGFKMHLEETKGQIKRLDQVIESCNIDRKSFMTCPVMKAMIDSTAGMIANTDKGAVRDALLIASGQSVEHAEITSYGTLIQFAKKLGYEEAAQLLQQTLDEEKATDKKLTDVSDSVNDAANNAIAGSTAKKSAA